MRDRNARTGTFREQWAAPPRSLGQEPGRRSSEGPPSGAIPVPAVARLEFLSTGASTGQGGKRKGELGNVYRRAGRLEAPVLNLRGVFRRSAPSSSRGGQKAL